MKYAIWILVVVLVVLHQDYWQWHSAKLDFGFLPRALSYHVILSVAAATLWLLATRHAWPDWLDEGPRAGGKEDAES